MSSHAPRGMISKHKLNMFKQLLTVFWINYCRTPLRKVTSASLKQWSRGVCMLMLAELSSPEARRLSCRCTCSCTTLPLLVFLQVTLWHAKTFNQFCSISIAFGGVGPLHTWGSATTGECKHTENKCDKVMLATSSSFVNSCNGFMLNKYQWQYCLCWISSVFQEFIILIRITDDWKFCKPSTLSIGAFSTM